MSEIDESQEQHRSPTRRIKALNPQRGVAARAVDVLEVAAHDVLDEATQDVLNNRLLVVGP